MDNIRNLQPGKLYRSVLADEDGKYYLFLGTDCTDSNFPCLYYRFLYGEKIVAVYDIDFIESCLVEVVC